MLGVCTVVQYYARDHAHIIWQPHMLLCFRVHHANLRHAVQTL